MELDLALAAVPMSIARPLVKNWNKHGLGPQVIHRFLPHDKKQRKNAFRLYLPIDPTHEHIVVPHHITLVLAEKGYTVDDYINGIAVDSSGKRKMRIGKLIKDQKLLQEFANDPQRAAHKDEYTCVISCHPYDVLTMSTGRRWDMTSCMRLDQPGKTMGGSNKHIVARDIAEGTLVAYAISPEDTNINKPHARLLIKPFHGPDKSILFRVESSVYGTPVPGFKETVSRFLRQVNATAKAGVYRLAEGLYNDGGGIVAIHGDYDAVEDKEKFLSDINDHDSSVTETMTNMFAQDKRWLAPWIKISRELHGTYAASKISAMYAALSKQGAITAEEFGQLIDQNAEDYIIHRLVMDLGPKQYRDELVKHSKLLTEEREFMVYDPDHEPVEDWILEKYAYYDSRWLAKFEPMPNKSNISLVFRRILTGTMKWTPEWENSELKGAKNLRKIVGLCMLMVSKATEINTGIISKEQVAKVVEPFLQDDPTFDMRAWAFFEPNMRVVFSRYVNDPSAGLLCALDNSWPATEPELVVNSGRVIMQEKVFNSIMALDDLECNAALFNNTLGLKVQFDLNSGELFRKYPWMRPLYKKVAAGQDYPERMRKRAQEWLAADSSRQAELDDIFDQLNV